MLNRKYFPFILTFCATLFGLLSVTLFQPPPIHAQGTTCPDIQIIAYWKLDETSGTTFDDFIGSNDASCTGAGCPAFASGRINGALSFDGGDDELTIAHHNLFNWTNSESFTIEAWITTTVASGLQVVVGKEGAENSFWRLGLSGNQAIFVLRDANGTEVSVTGSSAIADGKWHHLAAVRDNSTNQLRLYVDGAQDGSQATTYTGDFSNSGSITIGTFEGSNHFTGGIDEVALHNKTLSAKEIKQHYYDGNVGLRWGYCACGSAIKIMPLGNSITHGIYSATSSAIFPLNELVTGYRQPLYISLTNRYEVDFVGGEQSGQNASPAFDTDHEGHRGETASQMNSAVTDRLSANPPEVVLLHIGTNNLNQSTAVEGILDKIDAQSTAIPVILARIIRRYPEDNTETTDFNNEVEMMAQTRLANGDKIIIVDQETALTYPDDMYDDGATPYYHPNQTGYNKMADVWEDALDDILPISCKALAVSLASFSATRQADQILIEWQTVFEIDNLGFHIWRSSSPDAPTERLTKQLIPAQAPGSGQGMSYQWLDDTVEEGQTYYYWLEDVDVAGMTTRHGPVSATVSPPTALTLSTLDSKPRNEANDTQTAWLLAIIAFTLLVGPRVALRLPSATVDGLLRRLKTFLI